MNGLGRIHFPFDVGRWSTLGLAAAALLLLGRHTIAQDDPRDVESLRHRDVNHESRLELARDIDRERRVADGAVDNRRIDPRIIERRNRLYQDLKQDFHSFDKDNFDTDPGVRRLRSAPPVGIVESNETLENVRRLVDRFAQEADALQLALNQNVDYIRGVRGVLPDAIQFSANAQVLRDRCQREGRLAALCGDYEAFDRDWQAISYRLHQIPEMSRTAELKRVDVMDNLDRQLSTVLKIQPQFDQHDLLHHISALTDQLQRLAEDIDVEFVDPEQRRILGGQARRVESEAQMVCDTMDAGNDASSVVGEFKEYQALWYPLARQSARSTRTGHSSGPSCGSIARIGRSINCCGIRSKPTRRT